jgi:hypothetical protein
VPVEYEVSLSGGSCNGGRDQTLRETEDSMSRTAVNFAVDVLLLLITLALLFTTAVLRLVFPVPTASAGWVLWGSGYDGWANFQFVLMLFVAGAVLVHIMLHWSWVCGVVITKLLRRPARAAKLDDGSQTLWGVGMLIVVLHILAALVGLAYLTVQPPPPL